MDGGKVLGSGTYGCIFKPVLPCKGEITRDPDYVSKLMRRSDADDEFREITSIKDKVKEIKNYNDFFILGGIRKCELGALTDKDLEGYQQKCMAMTRHNFTKDQMKSESFKKDLRLLQLPDGGKDISHFFTDRYNFSIIQFMDINNSLVKLLKGGIIPLTKKNIIHLDIKSKNVVYSPEKGISRLIDWGLTNVIEGTKVPMKVFGWPIMFNQPITSVIFQNKIIELYNTILASPLLTRLISNYKGSDLINFLKGPLKQIIKSIIFKDEASMTSYTGIGHQNYITSIFDDCLLFDDALKQLKAKSTLKNKKYELLAELVSTQVTMVFLQFSVKNNKLGKFNQNSFFTKVYKKNCDIFGLLSCYIDLVGNKEMRFTLRKKIYETIIKPFMWDCTSENKYSYTKYDYNEVLKACIALNDEYLSIRPIPKLVKKTTAKAKPKLVKKSKLKPKSPAKAKAKAKAKPKLVKKSKLKPKSPAKKIEFDEKKYNKEYSLQLLKKKQLVNKLSKKGKEYRAGPPKPVLKKKSNLKPVLKTKKLASPVKVKAKRCPNGTRRDKKTKKCVPIV